MFINVFICLSLFFPVYYNIFLLFFTSDRKLLKVFSFQCYRFVDMFNWNFCDPGIKNVKIRQVKRFQHVFAFFIFFSKSNLLHIISKLDIFKSMSNWESFAEGFFQTNSVNSIFFQFEYFLLKTFETVWLRTENLSYPFPVLSVPHTAFFCFQ